MPVLDSAGSEMGSKTRENAEQWTRVLHDEEQLKEAVNPVILARQLGSTPQKMLASVNKSADEWLLINYRFAN